MSDAANERLAQWFRRRPPQSHHHPAWRDSPDERHRRAARGRPTLLTWGLMGPGKGIERVIDAMASLNDAARSAAIPGCRPNASQGAGRRWRGVPRSADGAGEAPRRRGFGVLRSGLPQHTDVDRAHSVSCSRRPALRLDRPGHLRCSGRRRRERPARHRHRVPACCRAARQWGGHRRRARRSGCSGVCAAPGADATAPGWCDGGRGPSAGARDGVAGRRRCVCRAGAPTPRTATALA